MYSKLKLMTIVGTRPEIIKMSEIIKACDKYFNHILVHTGQNWDYTLNDVFFNELGLRAPDVHLDAVGEHLGETIGNIISSSYALMAEQRPDALLILGDTNSALSAISAKRLKVPIFHLEAGNRCFDQNLPEEINRKIVDHLADVNLCYTEHARRYLIAENYRKEHIFVTGSPLAEVLSVFRDKIDESSVLEDLGLEPEQYILLSAHREENLENENAFISLMDSVNSVSENYGMPIIYSIHPRSRKIIDSHEFVFHENVREMRPFGFFDYNKLQVNSFCVISDSGTLPEESSILGFPGVMIRTSTERPEALDKGATILGGVTGRDVLQSIALCREMWDNKEVVASVTDYVDTNISAKVVKIIQSYTHIINRVIWRKQG